MKVLKPRTDWLWCQKCNGPQIHTITQPVFHQAKLVCETCKHTFTGHTQQAKDKPKRRGPWT